MCVCAFVLAYICYLIIIIIDTRITNCLFLFFSKTYSQFLPTGSYLSVDDFKSPKDLADCLQGLCSTKESLKGFHSWRKFFDVKQEHAYFGSRSVHYCRVCEALNYNSEEPKVYSNFKEAIRIEDCRNDFRHPFL